MSTTVVIEQMIALANHCETLHDRIQSTCSFRGIEKNKNEYLSCVKLLQCEYDELSSNDRLLNMDKLSTVRKILKIKQPYYDEGRQNAFKILPEHRIHSIKYELANALGMGYKCCAVCDHRMFSDQVFEYSILDVSVNGTQSKLWSNMKSLLYFPKDTPMHLRIQYEHYLYPGIPLQPKAIIKDNIIQICTECDQCLNCKNPKLPRFALANG